MTASTQGKRLPVTLLSGFLGTGKTTLLNDHPEMLAELRTRRVGPWGCRRQELVFIGAGMDGAGLRAAGLGRAALAPRAARSRRCDGRPRSAGCGRGADAGRDAGLSGRARP